MRDASPTGPNADPVRVQLHTTCERLGFDVPADALRLKVFRSRGKWVVLAWTSSDDVEGLVAWMTAFRPEIVRYPPDLSRRVVWFEFDEVPWPLAGWPVSVALLDAALEPDGAAALTVAGPREAVAGVVRSLGSEAQTVRHADRPEEDSLLTGRQLQALRAAVQAGYYDIPRPVGLRELGKRLGISSPALSELLRRAEREVIGAYVAKFSEPGPTTFPSAADDQTDEQGDDQRPDEQGPPRKPAKREGAGRTKDQAEGKLRTWSK